MGDLTERGRFFNSGRNREVYSKLINGQTVNEICDKINMKRVTMLKVLKNRFMLEALDEYINLRLFDFDLKKIDSRIDAFKLLEAEFKNRLQEASDDTVVKAYLQLLLAKERPKSISNDLVTLLMGATPKKETGQTSQKRDKDLEKEFGFPPPLELGPKPLTHAGSDKQSSNSKLDQGPGAPDQ